MCRMLDVSVSGYYGWRARPASARSRSDVTLRRRIKVIFAAHRGRYGVRRIHAELARTGVRVGYKRALRGER
jgi:putative transposase